MAPLWLPQVLAGDSVRLDPYTLADAEAHAALEDREMRLRFDAPDPDTPPSVAHVRGVIERWRAARAAGGPSVVYAIREAGVLAGGCELRRLDEDSLNLSYWIYPGFRGRGLAARAVALLLRAARQDAARRAEAHVDADNVASQRTALACGFVLDGEARDEAPDGSLRMRLRYVKRLRPSPQ